MVWMEMRSCFVALVFENGAVVRELAGINFAALCRLALPPLKISYANSPMELVLTRFANIFSSLRYDVEDARDGPTMLEE